MYIIQRIHAFLFGRRAEKPDSNLSHGLIILGNQKEDRLLVAHSDFSGIHSTARNYLEEKDVTELIVYKPLNQKLKDALIERAEQTAFMQRVKTASKADKKKMGLFSLGDMFLSFFYNGKNNKPSYRTQKRAAYMVADLLLGNRFLNRKNRPRSFFCTPYAISVLQSTMLAQALKPEEKEQLGKKGRKELGELLLSRIQKQEKGDPFAELYWNNSVCRLNSRFVMTSYAALALDKISK